MKTKFIKSFEERLAFYIFISVIITVVVETLTSLLIYRISSELRFMGYRSSMIGPDGLNPAVRGWILLLMGILVFVLCFYYLIHDYMK